MKKKQKQDEKYGKTDKDNHAHGKQDELAFSI